MLVLIKWLSIATQIVQAIIRFRKLSSMLLMFGVLTPSLANAGWWGTPSWVTDLRKQAEVQQRQVDRMTDLQSDVTAGARDLVAADAAARREWIGLQSQIAGTHDRLDDERRAIVSEHRFDSLMSSSITAVGSIMACLVPLLLVAWLVRKHCESDAGLLMDQQLLDRAFEDGTCVSDGHPPSASRRLEQFPSSSIEDDEFQDNDYFFNSRENL